MKQTPTTAKKTTSVAGFRPRFHPRILGTPAPVFPGFEIDICDHVGDTEKPDAVWHRDRARGMIRAHPEIKDLFVRTPATAVYCVVYATVQVVLALVAGQQPLWLVVAMAYILGSLININLFLLGHECNHNLVFKRTSWNRWLFTWTTLPMFLSGHHTWWIEHHVHHNDLGAKKDFIKRRRSFFLLTRPKRTLFFLTGGPIHTVLSWLSTPLFTPYALLMLILQALRSTLGLIVYFFTSLLRGKIDPNRTALAILADEHLVSGYERYEMKRWAVVYPVLSLGLAVVLFLIAGWKAVLFLLLSQLFMTGFLHPLMFGMILSNSHFHGHKRYQPSASYYGRLNRITLNFGLHTEHHDIAGIPWNLLPKLRQIAPEFYDNLVQTRSFCALAFQFAFGSPACFEEHFDNEAQRNRSMIDREVGATDPPVTAERG